MSTLAAELKRGIAQLTAAGLESPRLDTRLLLAHAMGVVPSTLIAGSAPSPTQSDVFDRLLERRARREPVAYITGMKEFWSLEFRVGPGVLVPRPDTETLITEALRDYQGKSAPLRVVDFGVGSGAILLSFLSEYPQASGVGIDSSAEALGWARRNAVALGLNARCEFVLGNWAAPDETFDIVFSNPPYLTAAEVAAAPAELGFEPIGALDGGVDGLDAYRALGPLIASRLKPEGTAFLEIGQGQGEAVTAIMAANGLEIVRIAPDLAGVPRCIVARLEKTPWKTVGKTGRAASFLPGNREPHLSRCISGLGSCGGSMAQGAGSQES